MDFNYILGQNSTRELLFAALGPRGLFPLRHVFRGIERPKGHPMIEFAQADDLKMLEWEAAQWVPPRDILRLLSDDECRKLHSLRIHFTTTARSRAAELGLIQTVRWFIARGYVPDHIQVIKAARAGQLEMVQYLLSDEANLADDSNFRSNMICGSALPRSAIESGNLELIKWLHGLGCVFDNKDSSNAAALYGHTHIVRWMRENRLRVSSSAYKHAAERGHLSTLEYLHELERVGDDAISCAATGGQLEMIKWLLDRGYKPRSSATRQASRHGHCEVILYLLSIGVKWHGDACIYAALNSAKMLAWVLDHGAPWNSSALSVALNFSIYEVMDLVLARGLPIKERDRKRCARITSRWAAEM